MKYREMGRTLCKASKRVELPFPLTNTQTRDKCFV